MSAATGCAQLTVNPARSVIVKVWAPQVLAPTGTSAATIARNAPAPEAPLGDAKKRFCVWLIPANENAGVVVFVATLTLKSGEKFPDVTCVTVPAPPAGIQFAPPAVWHARRCVVLSSHSRSLPVLGFAGAAISAASWNDDPDKPLKPVPPPAPPLTLFHDPALQS